MEDDRVFLGLEGLVNKHDFVRIIIQCLYSLGYRKSASFLEEESGIKCKSAEFEKLEMHILNGSWDDCINVLNTVSGLMDDTRKLALFLVFRMCLLEYVSRGDDSLALSVLRRRVSKLGMDKDKIQNLVQNILLSEDMELGESRQKLVVEMEKLLPPPITMPARRLEYLVEAAVVSQIDSCLYHNSPAYGVSLYKDHCCTRDQIPTETIQILTEHSDEVWFVQFSHNGEYLASSSSDRTAIIWEVLENGPVRLKHTLRSHRNPVSFVAWSPDDTKLLTCGNGEVVRLWDVETGTCKHTFGDNDFVVGSCAWFPDSNRLVCGSSLPAKGICMWDCDGNEIKAWRGMRMPKILDLAVTPNGENLISILSERDIRILNLATNVETVISEEHPVASLSVSGDGKFFIVNLNSEEIHMWDVAGEFTQPLKYTGHCQSKYVIRSCFGGLNSRFIASGSEDSQVYIWNRKKTQPIEVLSGHKETVNSVSWNPTRHQMLASASDDHTIRIWASCVGKR